MGKEERTTRFGEVICCVMGLITMNRVMDSRTRLSKLLGYSSDSMTSLVAANHSTMLTWGVRNHFTQENEGGMQHMPAFICFASP